MAAVNGSSEGGPPPPSPLTGCYLLIVIGEPHSKEHKDIILQRVAKGEQLPNFSCTPRPQLAKETLTCSYKIVCTFNLVNGTAGVNDHRRFYRVQYGTPTFS